MISGQVSNTEYIINILLRSLLAICHVNFIYFSPTREARLLDGLFMATKTPLIRE